MECCRFHTIFRVIFKVIANGSKHIQITSFIVFLVFRKARRFFSVNIYSSIS